MHSIQRSFTTPGSGSQEHRRSLYGFLVVAILLGGPLAAHAQGAEPPRFADVTRLSGLDFKHTFGAKTLQNVLMTTGSGCALFDYDNDGWLDAFFVNGTYLDETGRPLADKVAHHALFHNRGDGTFERVTDAAGLSEPSYGQGCATGDFDGDGFTDIYVTNYGPNRLYRNRGDGTFEDVTERSGTGDPRYGAGAVFFDYDGDADLDLFVANYLKFRPDMKGVHSSALSKRTGFKTFPGPRDYPPESDLLYENKGDGTFEDATQRAGLILEGRGLTCVAVDFDEDGDQDIFVANDRSPNLLYRNDSGRFVETGLESGIAYDPDGVESAAMGLAVVDVDNDGRQDLYVTNMLFEFNNMYRNLGGFSFSDITRTVGLDKDNFRHVGWATAFYDFNHDSELDCFVANGHIVDYVEGFSQSITYPQRNMLFLGTAGDEFRELAKECGKDFARKRVSRGAAFGDYDNDGDVDILVLNSGEQAQLFRNDTPPNDRWLEIRLRGQPPNTHGIGAKVRVHAGDRTVFREVMSGPSYLSSSDPRLHVGIASSVKEVVVEVDWPSGKHTTTPVRPGRLLVVDEPGAGEP